MLFSFAYFNTGDFIGILKGINKESIVYSSQGISDLASWRDENKRMWFDLSPDGKSLLLVPFQGNELFVCDLHGNQRRLVWRSQNLSLSSVRWTDGATLECAGWKQPTPDEGNPICVFKIHIGGPTVQLGGASTWGDYVTNYQHWSRAEALAALPSKLRTRFALDTYLYTVGFGRSRALPFRNLGKTVYVNDNALHVYDWASQTDSRVPISGSGDVEFIRFADSNSVSVTFASNLSPYTQRYAFDTGPGLTDAFMKHPTGKYWSVIYNLQTGSMVKIDNVIGVVDL